MTPALSPCYGHRGARMNLDCKDKQFLYCYFYKLFQVISRMKCDLDITVMAISKAGHIVQIIGHSNKVSGQTA